MINVLLYIVVLDQHQVKWGQLARKGLLWLVSLLSSRCMRSSWIKNETFMRAIIKWASFNEKVGNKKRIMAIRSQNIINSDEKWIVTNSELELVSLAYISIHNGYFSLSFCITKHRYWNLMNSNISVNGLKHL